MDEVISLHENLHESKRMKQQGVIPKRDFEKAYDKGNFDFLFHSPKERGFNDLWMNWFHTIVNGGTLNVKVNDDVGKN